MIKVVVRRPFLGLFALLFISSVVRDGFADNGQLALARPLSQITVDGDFADWPSSLTWYPIEAFGHGEAPKSANDLSGTFCVGYDQNALYVAVEVRDESIVIDGTRHWASQDGCSVYLDIEHHARDSKPTQFNIYGDGSPLYEAEGPKVASWSCKRIGTLHRYEWRFDIKRITRAQIKLAPGRVIGLDISLSDRDEDGSFAWVSWGSGTQKSDSSTRLGDILLVSSDEVLGKVTGRLVDEIAAEPLRRQAVMLEGENQTSPLTVLTDDRGEFQIQLPAGAYRGFTTLLGRAQRFQVPRGGETRVIFRATATTGRAANTLLGAVERAGKTTRIGRLCGYIGADDLPWGNVAGIAQAADGSLWIAGWNGLTHFDGLSIAAFEDQDGKQVKCHAVAIDQSGNVWGGNPQGLYRYNGNSVTHYTHVHGLVSGAVRQLVPAADGSLWIRTDEGISRFFEGSFTTILSNSHQRRLSTMAVESSTRLWFGTTSRGLFRLDAQEGTGESGSWQETQFGEADGLSNDRVRTLMIDSQGHLWIGGAGGLTQFDGVAFKSWTKRDGLEHDNVVALAETADGRLWIGTDADLVEFTDGQFTRVADTESLHGLFVDREQNIWLAGESLFRYDTNRPSYPKSLAASHVRKPTKLMYTRDGATWVGIQGGGVAQYNDEMTKRYSTDDGFVGGIVSSMLEDTRGVRTASR